MILADAVRGVLILSFAGLLYFGLLALWMAYILSFLVALFSPLFDAAADASVATLTDEQHLSSAVAINSSVVAISNVLGASLGSIFIALMGITGAFLFNGVSYIISLLLVLRIHNSLYGTLISKTERFIQEWKHGFGFLRQNPPFLSLMVLFGLLNFFAAPILLLIPLIVNFDLKESVSWVAILETCMAAGTGIMALSLSFVRSYKRIYMRMFTALLLMGFLLLLMGFFEVKPVLMTSLFLTGAGVAAIDALAISLFQHYVPYEMKGRFFSILSMVSFAGLPLSYMIFGFLSNYCSTSLLLWGCGVATLLLSLLILHIPRISNEIINP